MRRRSGLVFTEAQARDLNLRIVLAAMGTLGTVFGLLVGREGLPGAFYQIGRTIEIGAEVITSVPVVM